jgi:APA family basic amino acid/polyamine antiporter
MCTLPGKTWARLVIWFLIGMVVYFTYSIRHSRLRNPNP